MSPTILRMLLEVRRDSDLMGASPFSYYRQARRRSRADRVGAAARRAGRDEQL
jgi:hypothetical protein